MINYLIVLSDEHHVLHQLHPPEDWLTYTQLPARWNELRLQNDL